MQGGNLTVAIGAIGGREIREAGIYCWRDLARRIPVGVDYLSGFYYFFDLAGSCVSRLSRNNFGMEEVRGFSSVASYFECIVYVASAIGIVEFYF